MVTYYRKRKYVSKKRYRSRSRSRSVIPLYPRTRDSICLYFNNTYIYGAGAGTTPSNIQYYYTTNPLVSNSFVNLNAYFSKFRIEKMTIEFTVDQNAPISEVSMTEIHDQKPWPLTNASIDSQANVKTYSPNAGRMKAVWRMKPELATDNQFNEMPTMTQNPTVNLNGGIMILFRGSQNTSTTYTAIASINIKTKVRFQGRMAVSIT